MSRTADHMSHKDRTPRRRRIALGLGTAAGASLAAAFLSMGTAAADTDIPEDPFQDLFGTTSVSPLDNILNSVSPTFATSLDNYADSVVATDANAFQDLGLPASLDTANPTLSALLDPFADVLTSGGTGDANAFADLFGSAGAALDAASPGLSSALDPTVDLMSTGDANPFVDLFGASTFASSLDSMVDAIQLSTTVNLGEALDPFVDAFLNAF